MIFGNIFNKKKILITGHTGFKGSWLALWLQELGAEICGYSANKLFPPSHFRLLGLDQKFRNEVGDICDHKKVSDLIADFKPDVIFHLAAQALVRESLENPLSTIQTNAVGSATILDAVRKQPNIQAVIMVTSDKVYENHEWDWGYRETDQLGGKDPYSASKASAELIINSFIRCYFTNSDTIVAVGRAGNVIGGGDWALDRIVPDCIRAWTNKQPVLIRNPESVRPWQHVLEPLSGYLRLAEMALKGQRIIDHQAYNFGPNTEVNQTVSKLIEAMSARWPNSSWAEDTKVNSSVSTEAKVLMLSCEKARNELNWQPVWGFEKTLTKTIDWYHEQAKCSNFDAYAKGVEQIKQYCIEKTKIAQG